MTRQLLVQRGYRGTSIDAIARESGVSRTAVYRRWPSKTHVVYEAVFPNALGESTAMRDNPRDEVAHAVRRVVAFLGQPAARHAMPGLLSDLNPLIESQSALAESDWVQMSAGLSALIDLHPALFRRVDAETLLDTIVGAAFHACCVRGVDDLDSYSQSLTDLLFNGLLRH
ncbi:TetR/AcrR family transcriptional regulator [Mycobacterium sp. smrl_JER01]|uniref:TetR/AcrR family transcriptional regulator n=1 Tax=Mycobacterium sp. smrl_JER01 TaxID=3402633 RepID=UPI003AD7077B